jgi:hypothetical protein
MTEEKILSRVRKMLALANDEAATEGERENAMRMAHNLLTKHQLDMADVDAHAREADDPRGHFDNDGWNMPWCREVRATVAHLFMCKYYFQKINATRGKHHFVGRESQATTAMFLADWLVRCILKEGAKRYGHNLLPETRAFCLGASHRLWMRVREMEAAKQAEIRAQGYGLVLADQAKVEALANDEFVKAMGTDIVTQKARKQADIDLNAFRSGNEFGKGLSLSAQVGNRPGTKQLK